jgi:putative spermidine/putrescine transport system ATP-binding protein
VDRALEQGASLSEAPAAADVALRGLDKRYGATRALDGVSLDVAPGEFFTLLGPSGCGKTTTLRAVAGFVRPDAGDVFIRGTRVNDVPPHRRHVGLVFQSYALFPHRTVRQNVAFGLRMQRASRAEIDRRVADALALVQLPGHGERYPRELSGGEQQRVALARALVTRPAVLLLDEPLGALDKKLRDHMKVELKRLQRDVGVTTIYVTHDQEEALTMSDRVAVMRAGRIEQIGAPREIYETPRTVFVAGFIGNTNLLVGRSRGDAAVECAGVTIATAGAAPTAGAAVTVAVRPERIRLDDTAALDNQVAATVAHVVYQGETVRYLLAAEGGLELQAVELGRVRFPAGARVRAGWAAADARVLTS